MSKQIRGGLLCVLTVAVVPVQAADFDECRRQFYAKVSPDYTNDSLRQQAYPLCFSGFAVMYSGLTRTPLWSAAYLTRERIERAEQLPRNNRFHEESRLPESARARLADYSGSGYDRGHLSPNGDMASISQQYDSFSLANIAPQAPRNNRYVWRNIETTTRHLTKQYGKVYVVTGVAFTDERLQQLNGRVMVPSHFFKAVYIPAINQAGVYYAPNDESERIEVISLDELTARTGMVVMPAVDAQVKAQTLALPTDGSSRLSSTVANDTMDSESPWWWQLLLAVGTWLVTQLKL